MREQGYEYVQLLFLCGALIGNPFLLTQLHVDAICLLPGRERSSIFASVVQCLAQGKQQRCTILRMQPGLRKQPLNGCHFFASQAPLTQLPESDVGRHQRRAGSQCLPAILLCLLQLAGQVVKTARCQLHLTGARLQAIGRRQVTLGPFKTLCGCCNPCRTDMLPEVFRVKR